MSNGSHQLHRLTCRITGTVQGVGFRPAIVRLAHHQQLGGWVQNRSDGVHLCLQGPEPAALHAFLALLPAHLPAHAHINAISDVTLTPAPESAHTPAPFHVRPSCASPVALLSIPADLATCPACRHEVYTPDNRRYGYPFTTCTSCGPRYTIVEDLPYDRSRTSLAPFPLCEHCHDDYTNPLDRRFHAEALACPTCGPSLQLLDPTGTPLVRDNHIHHARAALHNGHVVAIMGIGGFQLAADATHPQAIRSLRTRKQRPHKPLAIMMPDLDTIRAHCLLSPQAAEALASPAAPIVILPTRPDSSLPFSLLAPDSGTIGVMLPTSPLHLLLLSPVPPSSPPPFTALVMTSGNPHGEPICLTPEKALAQLAGIADCFLIHNRPIKRRCDDSLVAFHANHQPQLWRRARGYAPATRPLAHTLAHPTLAMGADLKNTIALGWENQACLSPHIGDLSSPGASRAHRDAATHLTHFLSLKPQAIHVDLHPDLIASLNGEQLAREWNVPLIRIQHHHAHAAACLAEHGHTSGLALTFDGSGFGPDHTIWGAELLDLSPGSFHRLATFQAVPLPGGDAAVREPVRQLLARLLPLDFPHLQQLLPSLHISGEEIHTWTRLCQHGIHSPHTHAAGRLFDAVATLLDLAPRHITYEGQAAIRLESAARLASPSAHSLPFHAALTPDGLFTIDWTPAFHRLLHAPDRLTHQAEWALALHHAVADAAVAMTEYATAHSPHRHIALTGGVFMNTLLTDILSRKLIDRKLTPLIHHTIPPNDAGIAFGQLAASQTLSEKVFSARKVQASAVIGHPKLRTEDC